MLHYRVVKNKKNRVRFRTDTGEKKKKTIAIVSVRPRTRVSPTAVGNRLTAGNPPAVYHSYLIIGPHPRGYSFVWTFSTRSQLYEKK